jgi:transcriptional repressor NrdR
VPDHRRFTTYETVETTPLFVIKKDGRREAFSREKILNRLYRACEKRPIPAEKLRRSSIRSRRIFEPGPDG